MLCTAFAATLGFDAAFAPTTTRHAAARAPTLRRRTNAVTNAISDDLAEAALLLRNVANSDSPLRNEMAVAIVGGSASAGGGHIAKANQYSTLLKETDAAIKKLKAKHEEMLVEKESKHKELVAFGSGAGTFGGSDGGEDTALPLLPPPPPPCVLVTCRASDSHTFSYGSARVEPYWWSRCGHATYFDPPEWNNTNTIVLASNEEECLNTEYYQEVLKRFQHAPKVRSQWTGWKYDIYWPPEHQLRSLQNRPMLVKVLGEVFWTKVYGSCSDVDAVIYRSKHVNWDDCLTIHFLQGVSFASGRADTQEYSMSVARPYWTGAKYRDTDDKDGFCALVVKGVFKLGFYNAEALTRHALRRLLSEYKPCVRPKPCSGNHLDAWSCMAPYKFAITMENTQELGYLSEKIFSGVLAGTVPIYFGAPDVASYLNTDRFVFCNISTTVIQEMRSYLPQDKGQSKRQRTWRFDKTKPRPTDAELVDWATEFLRPHLSGCVAEVVALDQDDAAYKRVLETPLVRNAELFQGESMAKGIASLWQSASNAPPGPPVFSGSIGSAQRT